MDRISRIPIYVNLNPWESDYVKLLGINIDRSLKFDFHMLKVCSKANKKLTILSRMFKFLTFKKRRVLIKAFSESQFKYCPLVWMFLGRQINNKINYLHERTLRMIYEDSYSSFDTLGKRYHFLSMTEIFNNLKQKRFNISQSSGD